MINRYTYQGTIQRFCEGSFWHSLLLFYISILQVRKVGKFFPIEKKDYKPKINGNKYSNQIGFSQQCDVIITHGGGQFIRKNNLPLIKRQIIFF